MGYLGDSLRALALTLKSAFRPPVTVHFPAEKRPRAERFRTSFALVHDAEGDEACVGCLQCDKVCPSQIISMTVEKRESPVTHKRRGYATEFTLDLNACIYCELCVQVCPTDAIVMTREPEVPAYSREALVLTMDRLYANEKNKPLAWGNATKLMGMQNPKRGQAEEAPKAPAESTAAGEPKASAESAAAGGPKASAERGAAGEPKAPAESTAAGEPKAPAESTAAGEPKAPAQAEPPQAE